MTTFTTNNELHTDNSTACCQARGNQYLAKNPGGYCGMGGTGVSCPGASAV